MSKGSKAFEEKNRAICASIDHALNTLDHDSRQFPEARAGYKTARALLEALKRDPDKARRMLNGR